MPEFQSFRGRRWSHRGQGRAGNKVPAGSAGGNGIDLGVGEASLGTRWLMCLKIKFQLFNQFI